MRKEIKKDFINLDFYEGLRAYFSSAYTFDQWGSTWQYDQLLFVDGYVISSDLYYDWTFNDKLITRVL